MKEHRLVLGKVDYNKSGRKNCEAAIAWELKDGRFSMYAEIWNPRKTDCYTCGQCVDTVAAFFPHNKTAQRMLAIWREWHLNDMSAASPAQRAYLDSLGEWTQGREGYDDHYSWERNKLHEAGLSPDPSFMRNGKPYEYGSAWLMRTVPDAILAEIKSWSEPQD